MAVIGALLSGAALTAAELQLVDGSRIQGTLVKVHEGVVHFDTGFAGTLEIPMAQVSGLLSETPLNIRTAAGEVFMGPVATMENGTVTVRSGAGVAETPMGGIASAWQPGATDPIQAAQVEALEGQLRKWSYEAGVIIGGSDGNTDNLNMGADFRAKLEGPTDRLLFYGSYKYAQNDGVRSEDEQKGGVSYTNFFSGKLGWYAREELERDTFEGISFRSTTAAGLNYQFIKRDLLSLEGRAGLSYRYEDYTSLTSDSDGYAGLDFGLDMDWQFAEWGKLVSSLTYTPSVDDFGQYLVEHSSAIDIPLALSDAWKLRFGVSNSYNSEPDGNREKLDTTYFLQLLLSWD